MIHPIRFFLLISIFLIPHRSTAQYKFQINGHVKNILNKPSKYDLRSGDTVFLNFINLKKRDTAIINNSGFKFAGEVPYPSVAMAEYKYGGALILIDNSAYDFELTNIIVDTVHREYDSEIKTQSPFFNARKHFNEGIAKLYNQKNNYENRATKTRDQDSILYYNTQIKEIVKKIAACYKSLAADKANSYLAAYVVPAAPDFSYDGYAGIYNELPDSIKNTFYGKNFRDRLSAAKSLQSTSEVNDNALGENSIPAIYGVDTAFNKVSLDSRFFKEHKYTIIEFWASWCIPCRDVNKDLRGKTAGLNKKGIALIGFSLDKTLTPWKTAIKNDQLNWLQISDFKATDSPVSRYFNLTYIPYNIIVDSEGKIVKRHIYGEELESFLKSVN